MTVNIHPTAIVDPKAQLGANVEIGPYSIVGPNVVIGDDCWVGPHVVIEGYTTIGDRNKFYQFSSIGAHPQDKKYAGEPTKLVIGDDNTVREFCTFNTGTSQDGGLTKVGNHNWIMAYVHVAHDCVIGDRTIFANNAQLAGHVHVGDWAILGGFTVVHQFVHIGAHSMTGMGTILFQDVPAYVMVTGNPSAAHGINSEGLKRRGFTSEEVMAIKRAYKTIYRNGNTLAQAKDEIAQLSMTTPVLELLMSSLNDSTRGIVR
ncbi:acyl-ACP--UDP-N-acetylglucosamine O-acyltransferase [Leeia sp. TBRC 13508]|uniref:Acyl-[acyl-carrier-protein]--UDP-N-acetylglucosamine O-acyltransferase n=1 Tax=Leeia speluncae TaxID=2884804 RepID=A0ABS8D5Y8_9NEIS|nr:acyl-ACP--UDP-N-acetylglucosamine O-acyltransferase [Leeia speluncae]MCB6183604.1 acyl-ACP--UDP-N-acetylglucosamine O-acyltransferase [Leeia speluncae]